MDEFDSGGRRGDKGPGAEDEGSTAPLLEKATDEEMTTLIELFKTHAPNLINGKKSYELLRQFTLEPQVTLHNSFSLRKYII
ncbi:hypothetical protein J1N35_008503 [Gossypium stocksii]|uniref:Uncharacterized protein n=1 Tax=Gossypium stocksii TaxID=47602 RepID=A0A9D4AGJ6_9ROSI|nr:hypothetical protein J1N35_008503 [Gossypium stocksii]